MTSVGSSSIAENALLLAVSDIMLNREMPDEAFAQVRPILDTGHIVFGNCESVYSERGAPHPMSPSPKRAHPRNGRALGQAGFTVMSCANNHILDYGPDAQTDTLALLRRQGILTAGAGSNIAEARLPAIASVGNVRVGFLAYASVFPPGYEATDERPGLAPLRVHTHYEIVDVGQPGTPPRIHTFAHRGDLQAMKDDVESLRGQVDVLVVSIHWGLHLQPVALAGYEHELATAAIDSGADLILGHHQHILKGVDVYKGKLIFHGLGNFVVDLRLKGDARGNERLQVLRETTGDYAVRAYPDYPSFPFHPESRQTMVVGCVIRGGRIDEVSFLPCMINRKGQPTPLKRGTPDWQQVVDYLDRITREAGLGARFVPTRWLGESWVAVA